MTIKSLHGPWEWASTVDYAQGARVGDLVFTGGIGPFDENGDLIDGDFEAQARQTFENLARVLEQFGTSLANVASMNVFIVDPADYDAFKAVRPEFLSAPFPASTATGVGRLLIDGMKIEMNAVAVVNAERQPHSAGTP